MPSFYPKSRILRLREIAADLKRRFDSPFNLLENEVDPSADLLALAALDDTDLPDGTFKHVKGVGGFYLDRNSTDTPDGSNILSTSTGVGRWIVDPNSNPYYPSRWKDLMGAIEEGVGAGALTFEAYRDTPLDMFFWRYNQNDELNFRYQMQHDWESGTVVHPHLHVLPMASSDGDVVVDGYYAWVKVGDELPALSGWTSFKVIHSITGAQQYTEQIISLGVLTPPVGAHESAILMIYMRRPSGDSDDTYDGNKDHGTASANLGLLSADVHYQVSKSGSINEGGDG